MDVDGFTAHTFAAFTHGLDQNEIVVIGGEAELHSGFVGRDGVDVIVAMSLQQNLRQREGDAEKWANAKTVILDSGDKSELCSELGPTKYPVTFDSVSIATTGSQCSVSVEPIMVHCILSGARSGARNRTKGKDILQILRKQCMNIDSRFIQ